MTFTENQQKILWFTRIRWTAIILITILVFFIRHVQGAEIPLLPLFVIIIAAIVANILIPILTMYYKPFYEEPIYAYLRSSADLLVVTLVVHLTGGIESPFILLYLPELVMTAMFGSILFAYLLAAQATALYAFVCVFESYLLLPHYNLSDPPAALYLNHSYIISMCVALLFTSLLVVYMSAYLAHKFIEKQKEIESLSNAQVDFMNQVMHETKSPLTSIIGYTDTLLGGSFGAINEEEKEPLHIIKRQAQRILNMTNDLLDIARLESGSAVLLKKMVSLGEVLESAIQEMKPLLDSKKLELVLEIDPHLPEVPMEEVKIIQVVINLLSNAIKFSKPGRKIFISTQLLEREVQVSVRDEGLGIKAEDLPHIFQRFYRASKEAVAVRGTGLGLALTRGIVEAHGGRIWAVSGGENKGAVFHFTLPL